MVNLILLSSVIALSSSPNSITSLSNLSNENIVILDYEQLEEYNFDINNDKAVFFLKEINNKESKQEKHIVNDMTNNKDSETSVDLISLGEYYVDVNGNKVKGEFVGTEYTTNTQLYNLVDEVSESIKSKEFELDYLNRINQFTKSGSFEIGSNWIQSFSTKVNGSLDYENLHYGDYSEWKEGYYIKTNNYIYYLLTNETYSIPNTNGTDDFRTSGITYDFNDNSSNFVLRDYGPKSRNPEATIGFSSSIGAEINSDGSSSLNASVSTSYTTIVESPAIYDQGNMANDNVKIQFTYVDPWTEKDPWYNYNKNQSMQRTFYILRESLNNKVMATSVDKRTISISRDDFWPWFDKTVNFNTQTIINLDVN